MFEAIRAQVYQAAGELLRVAGMPPGQILVVGCSTSEVQGKTIGTAGSTAAAQAILAGLQEVTGPAGIFLAVQCCEHLNRALVVEQQLRQTYCDLVEVAVRPVPSAGGSLAALAMERFENPVVVEAMRAHAGLDIGETLIGMHLRAVAVPVRLQACRIGQARVTAARTRPKLIGGTRAQY
ncbi:MAG: TIGR01440 family protein [Heliobacteriaceae bacterium]|nr:TIGR01440 family protein [Heliobacteriaceae bacterium]